MQLTAYKPHPSSDTAQNVQASIQIDPSRSRGVKASTSLSLDRLDTNESPYDLPPELKEKLAWTYQQLIETNRYPDGGHETLKSAICRYAAAKLSPFFAQRGFLKETPLPKSPIWGKRAR